MIAARDSAPAVVSAGSTVTFRPLFFRAPERASADWVVGHEPSDTCIALPEVGIIVIQHLQGGTSVEATRAAVLQRCGEDVDVADLVVGLADVGLVAEVDGQSRPEVETIGQHWLARIRPEWVRWLCARPTLLLIGLLFLAGPLVLLVDSGVRPQPTDVLWNPSYAVDFWVFALLGWLLVLKHELGHLLTARTKGLACELRLGRRLFYLVVVSRIAGIWKLARYDRLLIYGAGIASDCATAGALALLLVAADAHLVGLAPMLRRLFRLLLVSQYAGVAWEFQIFMKTDVYHVVADLTDIHDLPERGRAWLASLWRSILSALSASRLGALPTQPPSLVPPPTRDTTYWITVGFALLQIVGLTGSFLYLFLYLVPANLAAVRGEIHALVTGLALWSPLTVLDAVVALSLQAFFYGFLARSLLKKYRPWRRAGQRASASREEDAASTLKEDVQ